MGIQRHTKVFGLRGLYIALFLLAIALPIKHFSQSSLPNPGGRQTTQAPNAAPHVSKGSGADIAQAGKVAADSFTTFLQPPALSANVQKNSTSSSHNPVADAKKPDLQKSASIVRNLAAKTLTVDGVVYPLRTYAPLATPNDPLAAQPWVTNTKMTQAWDTPVGTHDTLLAVIDTGFALKHEEFSNRWYINPGESGPATTENPSKLNCTDRGLPISQSCNLIDDNGDGVVDDPSETGPATYQNPSQLNCTDQHKALTKDCNLVDDDANGYVDDVSGWDFANNDNSPQAGQLNPNGAGTTHGTETAGTAAATGNNGKGIAGVDWHTKILPLQALDDDSYGDTLSVGRAIQYAASQHANVISISLGSAQPDDYVRYSIAMAIEAGSTVVAAAGNTSCNCMLYPANYPEVLSVGALDTNNLPASFTSYGTNLDIMAPGTQVIAPTFTAGNQTSAYVGNLAGTSFATPIVSGLLTRLLSIQPNMSSLQLMAAVTESTNRAGIAANVSRTTQLGYGLLDAQKSTSRVTTAASAPLLYAFTPVSQGTYLYPGYSTEAPPLTSYTAQKCADGQMGTTPLYELAKPGSSSFWSISQSEVWQAQQYFGYTTAFQAESCLRQPQDSVTTVRNINLFTEFQNIFKAL